MRIKVLITASMALPLTSCGNFLSDSDASDGLGNPANTAPGAYFKIDWIERGFSARGLTRCQWSGGQNGVGVLEVGFLDSQSDSEIRMTLVGFSPQNNQHQIIGAGRTSGGSIFLKAGGDQRLNTFRNQVGNGVANSSQCQIQARVQGTYVEAAFRCQNLFNDYGQAKAANGEIRCQTDQYSWEN